jgi:hypothetical protein
MFYIFLLFFLIFQNCAATIHEKAKKNILQSPYSNYKKEKIKNFLCIYSFLIQKKDLNLEDCADKYGLLKLNYTLKDKIILMPHLYKITQETADQKFSFLVLGSCHYLDFSFFSKNIKNLILSGDALLIENDCRGLLNRKIMLEFGMLSSANEVENLSGRERKHYNICVQDWFERYNIVDVHPEELTPYNALVVYCLSGHMGMDQQLTDLYKGKQVLKLENLEVLETVKDLFARDTETINTLNEKIKNDLCFGGTLNDPGCVYIAERYIEGDILPEFFAQQNDSTSARNHNWVPKFLVHSNQFPHGLVSVVGMAHLYGPNGLLAKFEQLNCTIQAADIFGEWAYVYTSKNTPDGM